MEEQEFQDLLALASPAEVVRLKVLYRGMVESLKEYTSTHTAAKLGDYQKAEKALEELSRRLREKYEQSEPTLPNLKAVAAHLQDAGWKVSQSSIYNHKDEGKLRPDQDGRFPLSAVEKYAATWLRPLAGSGQDEDLEQLQRDNLIAETRKKQAQARHWELKTKVEQGLFVPRDQWERALAGRATVFRADLENLARAGATEMIELVAGDPDRVPDLVEYLISRFTDIMNRYASETPFCVSLPEQNPQPEGETES